MDKVITIKEVQRPINTSIHLPEFYYVPCIDGKEYSHVGSTYEEAYIIGLGIKYLGLNDSQFFVKSVCRMLGIKSVWSE